MEQYCQRFVVSGHVQGVFFRKTTQEKATSLGLTGWVRNLETGEVELVACGTEAKLQELATWLWKGPTQAQVQLVMSYPHTLETFSIFSIEG